MLFTTQRAKGMFTEADSRVFLSRMTIISTFSAGTSNAMHSEPSWSNVQRTGDGGLCTVGFSRVNLGHGYCPPWPLPRSANWIRRVNEPLDDEELDAVRWSIRRNSPFGQANWVESIARRLDLKSIPRPRGRPKKKPISTDQQTKSPDPFYSLVADGIATGIRDTQRIYRTCGPMVATDAQTNAGGL